MGRHFSSVLSDEQDCKSGEKQKNAHHSTNSDHVSWGKGQGAAEQRVGGGGGSRDRK